MKQLLSVVVCMALASVLVAQDNAKRIVGVWEEAKGKGVNLEFTKDGKLKIKGKQGDKTFVIDGTYKVEGDKFSMTIGGKTDTSKIKKLTDSELHLEDFFSKVKGKLVEFKRLPSDPGGDKQLLRSAHE